ncbi:MAG TPA: glycosyltransferase family protein [Caulobacteraceae bacterium]|jgi:spore coat polysaccharide biosynthesis protein SpsF
MVLAVLQARMSSTRLPGKVMADLVGAPMILRQIERLRRSRRLDGVLVATSTDPSDDGLAAMLVLHDVPVHRGPLDDVLARYEGALKAHPADVLARLTADCPLADPGVIDATIDLLIERGLDYAANTPAHRTYPKGLDVEVMRADALLRAAREAKDPYEREHVTPYLYRRPDLFAQDFISQDADEGEVRWTVDRPDDLEFVQQVYGALYTPTPAFGSEDVRAFVRSRPDLAMLGGDRRV